VKIRTNLGREPGEKRCRIVSRGRCDLPAGRARVRDAVEERFRPPLLPQTERRSADRRLLGDIQQKLLRGDVPELRMYPRSSKLGAEIAEIAG